ncbi:SLC13 family permease [Crocinitomicaceae bacterium]|nr:SLC13 family permease [Crocinitomicaceae bacterium]
MAHLFQHKKTIAGIIGFIFFISIAFWKESTLENRAIGMSVLMLFFWVFEVVPIYVTALIPLVLCTPLGLLDPGELALSYGNNNVYLFLGGFILALALEKWGVHHQIASRILSVMGSSKSKILIGFGLSSYLLSMWISNTATTLMMLPMALSIIQTQKDSDSSNRFSLLLMLTVAYAASVGGMATLVGSPPNTQMAGTLSASFDIQISFWQWMKIGLPVSLIIFTVLNIFFQIILGSQRNDEVVINLNQSKWTIPQQRVLIIFGLVILTWVTRGLIVEYSGISFKDSSVAILGAIMLFIIPSKGSGEKLLIWSDTIKVPWGILVLFGGGIALASSLEKSHVLELIFQSANSISTWDYFYLLLLVIFISIFATELMSNLALVSVLVPIIAMLGLGMGLSVLTLCVPLTLAASCAFMMPISTPPNAIVFSSGKISIRQMASYGFFMNIFSVLIILIYSFFFL